MNFNVADDPWVPCMIDGEPTYLSLRDLFLRATEVDFVYHESVFCEVPLRRFLLALSYRILDGIENKGEWESLWDQGKFDATQVNAYFSDPDHHFDLFDTDHPFFQDAGFVYRKKENKKMKDQDPKPISCLMRDFPCGDTKVFHFHGHEEVIDGEVVAVRDGKPFGMTCAEVVPYLLNQAFFHSGGRGYRPSHAAGRLLTMSNGSNFFETTLLNLIPSLVLDTKCDVGSPLEWETPTPYYPDDNSYVSFSSIGKDYGRLLTWRVRKCRLIPSEDGRIYQAHFGPGPAIEMYGKKGEFLDGCYDPMMSVTIGKKDAMLMPIRCSTERSLWRELDAITCELEKRKRPICLSMIDRGMREHIEIGLLVIGVTTYGTSFFSTSGLESTQSEYFTLPVDVAGDSTLSQAIGKVVSWTNGVVGRLQSTMKSTLKSKIGGKDEKNEKVGTDTSDVGLLLAQVEPIFHDFMDSIVQIVGEKTIPKGKKTGVIIARYRDDIRSCVITSFVKFCESRKIPYDLIVKGLKSLESSVEKGM